MNAPRSQVVQSLPQRCAVCRGHLRVFVVDSASPLFTATQQATCPHCTWRTPIPIYDYPLRTDTPNGGAA